MLENQDHTALTRRSWLARTGALGLAAVVPSGVASALAAPPEARPEPAPATPSAALQRLVEGNRRFAQGRATNPNRTLARLQELGTTQQPFAVVLGCSDSRVPIEILFDQGFGDVFVARVAGNIATAEVIGSIEYATEVLGAVIVLTLGHTGCGAVRATLEGTSVPGLIGSLYPYIHPAVEEAGNQGIDAVVAENARNQVDTLRNASPLLAARLASGALRIEGSVFDFRTGLVTLLDTPPSRRRRPSPATKGTGH